LFRIESKDPSRTPNRSTIANLLLSLSFLSGKSLEDVYGYFKERVEDQKQLHQVYEGKEIALRMMKISKEADKVQWLKGLIRNPLRFQVKHDLQAR
jgi:hypothetical protein